MKKFNKTMLPEVREINKVETLSRTVNNYFTVIGEEGIGSPEDHYDQLETLKHANSGELYVCTISSSPGGNYSGLLAWKNALEMTEAHTVCILEGDSASACTIIPLYFDEVHVTPYTTFMCHSANFGISRNTALNVEANAVFQSKQVKRFIRDAYKHFLTEEEILKILDGAELYFDEFEIQERLQRRAELMEAEAEDCEDCVEHVEVATKESPVVEAPKPEKKAPSKKKAPTKKE